MLLHSLDLCFSPLPGNLPESNPVRMEETRKRSALLMQALKDAAETNDNIVRGIGGSK
ncbi:ubiquinol-cytochrome-c reductase complex assembly factor 3 [Scomber scombrus]|uniref:Ubiquinol-cytochrome-c reductase complex assembly factor 3 n=1 Tax=Scomber scombrus TaxID=13677 RepID=A0AAV1Q417_SCOSC